MFLKSRGLCHYLEVDKIFGTILKIGQFNYLSSICYSSLFLDKN